MPCRKQIKSNLYDTVDRLSSTGYGKNIRGAQSIANVINKRFGEEVVTFRLGDTIEREIYISPTLVDQYFEKELQLEIEEARKVQRLDARRAGVEYSDRYLYDTEDLFSDEVLRAEKDKLIAKALSDKFTKVFGVDSSIITQTEAELLLENSPTPLKAGVSAFFYGDKVYFIDGKFNSSNVLHEFAHPFMKAIQKQNSKLFYNLYDQTASTDKGKAIISSVKDLYPELEPNTDRFKEEVLVKAIELGGNEIINDVIDNDTEFQKLLKKILYAIKQVVRALAGKKVNLGKLKMSTTLDELVDMMVNKDFVIEDFEYIKSDLAEFRKETEQFLKDLNQSSDKGLQETIDTMAEEMQYQIRVLKNSPKRLKEELEAEGGRAVLENIRDYVTPFKTKEGKLSQENLDEVTDGLAEQESDLRTRSIALINSIGEIETFSNKINNILRELEKDKRHLSTDGIAKVQYFKKLLAAEKQFIDNARVRLKSSDRSNPFMNKLAAISQSIEDNLQLVSTLSKDFTVQFFEENTETMSENIRGNFQSEVKRLLSADNFTEEEIDAFLQDILNKIDNENVKSVTSLNLPRATTATKPIISNIKKYIAKKISRDTILNYLEGRTEDLGNIGAMYTPLGNVDDLLGSVYRYTKNKLSLSETQSLNQVNRISERLNPLFKAAGVDITNPKQVAEALLFVDTVAEINPNTNEIEEYEIYSIIDKFKGWRYDRDRLQNNVTIAHKSGDKDSIIKATKELNDFHEKYMNRPYTQEVYNVRKIWEQDNRVYDPSTKKEISVSAKVSAEAFVERQKALEELNVLNVNDAWTDLDDLLEFSASKEAKIKYDELYNLVDINGKYKQGEELQRVLVRRKYRKESKKFYQYSTDMQRFEDDYNHFINVVLAGEGITQESNPELFDEQVKKFLEKNTKVAYTSEYYQEKNQILNDLRKLQAKSSNNPVIEKLNSLYEERFRIVNTVTDKDGEPNGRDLNSIQIERLKSIETEIVAQNLLFDRKTGLSKAESRTLNQLNFKISKKAKLSADELKVFQDLTTRQNEFGMTSIEIGNMRNLYSKLNALRNITPTDNYIAAFNDALEGTGADPVTAETVEDFVLDRVALNKIFNETEGGSVFEEWFYKNHFERDMYDGEKMTPGFVRLKVWSLERPSDKKYYKTTSIKDSEGNAINLQGVPIAKYSTSTIKNEYRTIPMGADRSQYVGTIIDNRGNFLPKEFTGDVINGAFDDKYQNKKFYEMQSKNDAKFKLLQAYKKDFLGVQKDSVNSSRMYLDLPRFRQRTNVEAFTSGQTAAKLNAKKEQVSTALGYVSSYIKGKKDDAEAGFNFNDAMLYIPTDLEGNRITKVPVRGMYKLSLAETSTDALRSMWDYMYSLNEQKVLMEDEPVMNAVLGIISDDENAIKNLNVASRNSSKSSSRLNLITKNRSEDKRITALRDFIDRTYYGQRVSEFQQNYPGWVKAARALSGSAARAFFALNPQSSLKNRGGMQFNKAIEAAGGKHLDVRTLAKGKYRAGKATWQMATVGNYARGAKPMDVQISEAFDMAPGKSRTEFGESTTRTLTTDFFDAKWFYSDRKLMEQNSAMELGFGIMYKQMVDVMQPDGTVKQIPYADAWITDEEGVLKLKEGVDPEYSHVPINHTVGEGNTLESLAKQYSIPVEKLMAKNKIKSKRKLEPGEKLIISKSTQFNNLKLIIADANARLNGITDQLDSPLAEKYLVYNLFTFSRRFLTGMVLNRFQFDTAKNNRFGDVYNWNTNELTRGYYIDAADSLIKMLTVGQYRSKYMTDREKAAWRKLVTEVAYLAVLGLATSLLFGYDPGDEDRFKKIKAREAEYGIGGWMGNQLLYQLIMIEKENRLFLPLWGSKDQLGMMESSTIILGPTVQAYIRILTDVKNMAMGSDKAYYKADVGYYNWQKEGSSKVWNHLGQTVGLTGKNLSPLWAIKKNEQFENLR
jgi:LysM repeat protein